MSSNLLNSIARSMWKSTEYERCVLLVISWPQTRPALYRYLILLQVYLQTLEIWNHFHLKANILLQANEYLRESQNYCSVELLLNTLELMHSIYCKLRLPVAYKKSTASLVAVGKGSGGGGWMWLVGVAEAVTELNWL